MKKNLAFLLRADGSQVNCDAEIMSLEHLGYIEPSAREEGELQWRKDNGMEK